MSIAYGQGLLLAKNLPGVLTAVTLFTSSKLRTEITLINAVVVPGTAGNIAVDIYHDDDGTTYDNTTLIASLALPHGAVNPIFHALTPGAGIHVKPGGSIGVKVGTISTVNFTAYGVTQTLAERLGGLPRG